MAFDPQPPTTGQIVQIGESCNVLQQYDYVMRVVKALLLNADRNITEIQGYPVSAVVPTEGQVLRLISGVWTPTNLYRPLPAQAYFGAGTITTGVDNS
jgi:hypothetical protein